MNRDEALLHRAPQVARQAGNHPVGAILAGPDGTIVMEAGNAHGDAGDCTGHAERLLMKPNRAPSMKVSGADDLARPLHPPPLRVSWSSPC